MGQSSRRSGITEMGHSPGMVRATSMCFSRSDTTPGEKYVFGLDSRTVPNFPRLDATPGEWCAIDMDMTMTTDSPRVIDM